MSVRRARGFGVEVWWDAQIGGCFSWCRGFTQNEMSRIKRKCPLRFKTRERNWL